MCEALSGLRLDWFLLVWSGALFPFDWYLKLEFKRTTKVKILNREDVLLSLTIMPSQLLEKGRLSWCMTTCRRKGRETFCAAVLQFVFPFQYLYTKLNSLSYHFGHVVITLKRHIRHSVENRLIYRFKTQKRVNPDKKSFPEQHLTEGAWQ